MPISKSERLEIVAREYFRYYKEKKESPYWGPLSQNRRTFFQWIDQDEQVQQALGIFFVISERRERDRTLGMWPDGTMTGAERRQKDRINYINSAASAYTANIFSATAMHVASKITDDPNTQLASAGIVSNIATLILRTDDFAVDGPPPDIYTRITDLFELGNPDFTGLESALDQLTEETERIYDSVCYPDDYYNFVYDTQASFIEIPPASEEVFETSEPENEDTSLLSEDVSSVSEEPVSVEEEEPVSYPEDSDEVSYADEGDYSTSFDEDADTLGDQQSGDDTNIGTFNMEADSYQSGGDFDASNDQLAAGMNMGGNTPDMDADNSPDVTDSGAGLSGTGADDAPGSDSDSYHGGDDSNMSFAEQNADDSYSENASFIDDPQAADYSDQDYNTSQNTSDTPDASDMHSEQSSSESGNEGATVQ